MEYYERGIILAVDIWTKYRLENEEIKVFNDEEEVFSISINLLNKIGNKDEYIDNLYNYNKLYRKYNKEMLPRFVQSGMYRIYTILFEYMQECNKYINIFKYSLSDSWFLLNGKFNEDILELEALLINEDYESTIFLLEELCRNELI